MLVAKRGRLRAHLGTPLYRSAYLLILAAGSTSLFGFVFWALAARRYSSEVVGLNAAALSAMILVSGACQLGLGSIFTRYLPRAGRATQKLVVRSYMLSAALSTLAALATAWTSPSWAPSLAFLRNDPLWLAAFVVGTTSWTIFALQDNVMTGMRQAQWVPISNTAFSLTKVALLVAVATAMPRSGVFFAWIVPVLFLLGPVNALIFLRLIPTHSSSAGDSHLDVRRMARFGVGNYIGSLFILGSTVLLPIIVTNQFGAAATAYFFIPWTIASSLQLIALYMSTSLTVEVAMDETKLREYCRRVILQTLRLVVPIVLVVLVGAHYFLHAFGPSYAGEGANILRILAVASLPNIVVALGLGVARIQHSGRAVLLIEGAQCLGTLGLSALLVPVFGVEGIGIAWLMSQVAIAGWLILGPLRPLLFAVTTRIQVGTIDTRRSK